MSDQQSADNDGPATTAPATGTEPTTALYDAELVAAVTAAQLSVCTQTVPEALERRLAAAAQVPAGQWRRTAGNDDPEVQALEAPYKRLAAPIPAGEPKPRKAAKKATGANRRRSTTTQKEK